MAQAGYVYVKIKGKDSWCNDGFDYTLLASIDKQIETPMKMALSTRTMIAT